MVLDPLLCVEVFRLNLGVGVIDCTVMIVTVPSYIIDLAYFLQRLPMIFENYIELDNNYIY